MLIINKEDSMPEGWIADRELYWNADKSKILEASDDDSEKAFLICREGVDVAPEIIAEAGGLDKLVKKEPPVKKKVATKEVKQEVVEDKAVKTEKKVSTIKKPKSKK